IDLFAVAAHDSAPALRDRRPVVWLSQPAEAVAPTVVPDPPPADITQCDDLSTTGSRPFCAATAGSRVPPSVPLDTSSERRNPVASVAALEFRDRPVIARDSAAAVESTTSAHHLEAWSAGIGPVVDGELLSGCDVPSGTHVVRAVVPQARIA